MDGPMSANRAPQGRQADKMKLLFLKIIFVFATATLRAGEAPASGAPTISQSQATWGLIIPPTNSMGLVLLEVRTLPANGKLSLPTPFPNITAAHLLDGHNRAALKWVFNTEATSLL